jgi:hypothetical protein
MTGFIVIESTPGYMPDSDDPFVTTDWDAAVEYANSLADELEEQGYTCDRSLVSDNFYCEIHCERGDMVAPDLGRTIEIVRNED